MELEHEVVRSMLREALDRLQFKNPAYSLRAFSRRLKTAPATISAVLRGKRRLSVRQVERIFELLPLEAARKESALFLFKNGVSSSEVKGADIQLPFRVLTPGESKRLFRFPNMAVLALAETIDFEGTEEQVASRLNLSLAEAKRALRELYADGFLLNDSRGRIRPSGGAFLVPEEIREEIALSQFLRSSKLIKKLNPAGSVKDASQIFATSVFALDPVQLDLMRKLLRECIVRVALLGGSGSQKEVYQVSAQLIPLSNSRKSKR